LGILLNTDGGTEMKLTLPQMKFLKFIHCVSACCWLGGIASVIVISNLGSGLPQEGSLLGMNMAGKLVDTFIIIPAALACLVTGLIYGLFTGWGFFRHKWLLCKWIITIYCILSGTFLLGVWKEELFEISLALGNDALNDALYGAIRFKRMCFSIFQLFAMLFMVYISVFKPWKPSR
jgi:hypothetical protein